MGGRRPRRVVAMTRPMDKVRRAVHRLVRRHRRPLNIILFGQTGSGKSSVINLIAGEPIAKVSNRATGCTLSFEPYSFSAAGRLLCIWDTVGLDEPDMQVSSIEQACDLIHSLSSKGGVDLLLFCIRAPRITAASQANYQLFYEVLCKARIPIAFVITHLEREDHMDAWWGRNVGRLEKFGLKSAGHACVTGLPRHSKYEESRRNVHKLLVGGGQRFAMPPDAWFIEFSHRLGLFSPVTEESKRKARIRILVKRCGIDEEVAEELAAKLMDGSCTLGEGEYIYDDSDDNIWNRFKDSCNLFGLRKPVKFLDSDPPSEFMDSDPTGGFVVRPHLALTRLTNSKKHSEPSTGDVRVSCVTPDLGFLGRIIPLKRKSSMTH